VAATPGTLFIVSTPIGNLSDLTFRAVDVLRDVDLIVAEDTRHSRVLLNHYEITAKVASYHEHNEAKSAPRLVERLLGGESIALISDAGTPLLSDPGRWLVDAAVAADIPVVPIPGASALLAALVASGLATERFTFYGFLPRRGKERGMLLDEIASSPITAVLYESPSRLAESLRELAERAEARPAVVARELTKQFEELKRGTLGSLSAYYNEAPPRGEVVVLVAGAPMVAPDEESLLDDARKLRAEGMSVRDVAAALSNRGIARNLAYRVAREAGED
jgi:16S rRNA (cytidine1402-2'-O)-methyltransferase